MSLLLRGTELIGLPVVTIDGGEDVAEVKDVVYGSGEARLLGFTLNRRGFLGRPMREVLPWGSVAALGSDAVMIETHGAIAPPSDAFAVTAHASSDQAVLGADVLTDSGARLGMVTDVVVLCSAVPEVVGYEIQASEAMGERAGRRVFLPLPNTLAVSGEALMVPAAAGQFVADDVAGFGAAVEAFRAQLEPGTAPPAQEAGP